MKAALLSPRPAARVVTIAATALLSVLLAGCADAKALKVGPDTWTVNVKPIKGRLDINRAHRMAFKAASDHCAARKQQVKFVDAKKYRPFPPGRVSLFFTCRDIPSRDIPRPRPQRR